MITNSQDDNSGVLESSRSPTEALRQQLIDHIHRPVAWAKVGKHDDVYLMDVEKTDHLAEDMANYAMQIVTAYAATVEREAERTAFLTATTWATKYPEADKIWHEMLADAALQGTEEKQV